MIFYQKNSNWLKYNNGNNSDDIMQIQNQFFVGLLIHWGVLNYFRPF